MSFNWRMDQGNVVNLYSGILFSYLKTRTLPGLVAHTFNPSTWKAEAGEFLSLRPAWSTEWVPGQPGLYRETLSKKKKKTWSRNSKPFKYCPDWLYKFLNCWQGEASSESVLVSGAFLFLLGCVINSITISKVLGMSLIVWFSQLPEPEQMWTWKDSEFREFTGKSSLRDFRQKTSQSASG